MPGISKLVCDNCGKIIKNPSDGILEWISEIDNGLGFYIAKDLKILHQSGASPLLNESNKGCSIHYKELSYRDIGLETLLVEGHFPSREQILADSDETRKSNNNPSIIRVLGKNEFNEITRRLNL